MRMQLKMYSIRDIKGAYYNSPFFSRSHGEAERSFERVTKDPQSTINQYPADYDLYYVGDFDDQTAMITPKQSPEFLINAIQFKPEKWPSTTDLNQAVQINKEPAQKMN